jgi:hypothetical protein
MSRFFLILCVLHVLCGKNQKYNFTAESAEVTERRKNDP